MKQNKKIVAVLCGFLLALIVVAKADSTTVQRSNFIVDNLSCTSCLETIETELKGVPGTLGMDADLRAGRVTVDHLSTLDYKQIGAFITKLGYPATADWTATVPEQYTKKFSQQSSYRSGCSSGGCGSSGGAGPTVWKNAPAAGTVHRTTLQVSNLTCSSCLSSIAAELAKVSETFGMSGYLSRGIVIVDHTENIENRRIAAIISGLGYPARILATNEIPAQKTFSATVRPGSNLEAQPVRTGYGCSSSGPCNATSASWKKLYNRYFSQTNSK